MLSYSYWFIDYQSIVKGCCVNLSFKFSTTPPYAVAYVTRFYIDCGWYLHAITYFKDFLMVLRSLTSGRPTWWEVHRQYLRSLRQILNLLCDCIAVSTRDTGTQQCCFAADRDREVVPIHPGLHYYPFVIILPRRLPTC